MLLTVAVIGPAHALKGEVCLDVRTDDPHTRLAVGTVLPTDPSSAGPLTVARTRFDGRRWYATFTQVRDRNAAQALRGVRLLVDTDAEAAEKAEADAWYAHELVGLRALHAADQHYLGEVVDLEPGVAQDRLVVRTRVGQEVAVPFVAALVPAVDLEAGVVIIDPPGGLFPDPESIAEV